jgi:hypothetical protein
MAFKALLEADYIFPTVTQGKTLEQKTELRILKLRLNPLLDKV